MKLVYTIISVIILTVILHSCKKEKNKEIISNTIEEELADNLLIETYTPINPNTEDNYITISIKDTIEENLLAFGGKFNDEGNPKDISKAIYRELNSNLLLNIDFNGVNPSVAYQIDLNTGKKEGDIYYFSDFKEQSVICNVFEYFEEKDSAALTKSILFQKSGNTFQYSNNVIDFNLTIPETSNSTLFSTHEELLLSMENDIVFELMTWIGDNNKYDEIFGGTNKTELAFSTAAAIGAVGYIAIKAINNYLDNGTAVLTEGEVDQSAANSGFWDWVGENLSDILISDASANEIDPLEFKKDDDGDGTPNIFDKCKTTKGNQPDGCFYEPDCSGLPGGSAILDNCNECVDGNTGKQACEQDCNNEWGGTAFLDNCDICVGGSTGKIACSDSIIDNLDCNGTPNGSAFIDDCNMCVGGTTGSSPCDTTSENLDCHGTPNGSAFKDNCGECVGGETGKTACSDTLNADSLGSLLIKPFNGEDFKNNNIMPPFKRYPLRNLYKSPLLTFFENRFRFQEVI